MQHQHSHNKELGALSRGASWTGLWNIAGYALGFVAGLIIARLVGAEGLGTVAVGMSVLSVLQVVSSMGLDRGVLRYTSFFFGGGDRKSLNQATRYAVTTSLLSSTLVVLGYYCFVRHHVSEIFPQLDQITYVLDCFIPVVPIAVLFSLLGSSLQGLQRPQHLQFANSIIRTTTRIGFLIVLMFFYSALFSLALATVFAYLTGLVYLLVLFIKVKRSIMFPPTPRGAKESAFGFREFMVFSLPLCLIPLMNLTTQQVDTLLAGYYLESSEVGVYAISRRLAVLVTVPLFMFGTVAAATISKLLAKKDRIGIEKIYGVTTKWIFILSGIVFVFVFAAAQPLLSIFGEKFPIGAVALRILAVGQLVNAFAGPTGNVLIMLDSSRWVLLNSLVTMLVGGCLFLLLIPVFRLDGAAIATAVTVSLVNLMAYVELVLLIKIKACTKVIFFKRVLILLFCIGIAWGVSHLLQETNTILQILSIGSISLITMLAAVRQVEGISAEDIVIIRHALKVKRQ